MKGDRRQFVEPAVHAIAHPKYSVRVEALMLLAEIGTAGDSSPVVALLSDKDFGIVQTAAKTLAATGGTRELIAMDIWLKGIARQEDADARKHVKDCRDALHQRLNQATEKKK